MSDLLWLRLILTAFTGFYACKIYLTTYSRPALWLFLYNLNMMIIRLIIIHWEPGLMISEMLLTLNTVIMLEVLYLIHKKLGNLTSHHQG
jgi:hypothetical protein